MIAFTSSDCLKLCGGFCFTGVEVNCGALFSAVPNELGPLFRNSNSCSSVFFLTLEALAGLCVLLASGTPVLAAK